MKLHALGIDVGKTIFHLVAGTHQDDSFKIGNIPVGTYTLIAWHKMYGTIDFYSTNCRLSAIRTPFTSTTLSSISCWPVISP